MRKTLFKNVLRISKARGLSLKDVGKESGVGENSIYRWKKTPPNIRTLEKVANFLDVSIVELLK